ncbi:MAG: riboflavin kinase, partial [Alistipes sp.]|nr:riboflavin kinase [Alistipes sp.]
MDALVIEGVVTPGRQIGHTLGFPTANIALDEGLCENGVYRTQVKVEGIDQIFDAMSNVGYNPSVGGSELRLESHLFGFEGDLYGRRIWVCLVEKIRDERKFESMEELRAQLQCDKAQI